MSWAHTAGFGLSASDKRSFAGFFVESGEHMFADGETVIEALSKALAGKLGRVVDRLLDLGAAVGRATEGRQRCILTAPRNRCSPSAALEGNPRCRRPGETAGETMWHGGKRPP